MPRYECDSGDDGDRGADEQADLEDEDFDQETFDETFSDDEMRCYARRLYAEAKKLTVPHEIRIQSNYWTYTQPLLLHTIVRRRTTESESSMRVNMRSLLNEDIDAEDAWREMKDVYAEYMSCLDQQDKLKKSEAESIDDKLNLPLSTG